MTKAERLEEGIRFWEEELNAFKDEGIETSEMREYDRLVIEAARMLEKIIDAALPSRRLEPEVAYHIILETLRDDGWL